MSTHDRRRELAREYKEKPRTAGVGAVRNVVNGKLLLVSGTDVPSLLTRHQAQLKFGAHRNAELQRDWSTLGADAFTFEILDTIEPPDDVDYDPTADVATLETLWLDRLRPFAPAGYHRPPKSP